MEEMRCEKCRKLLAYMKGQAEIKCPRCKAMNYKETSRREATINKSQKE